MQKQAGLHWRGDLAGAMTSPGYEVNDLGFAVRTDRRDVQGRIRSLQTRPGRVLRSWQVNNVVRSERNYAMQPVQSLVASALFAQTLNYWVIQHSVQRFFRANDDRLTRGGPMATRPGLTAISLTVSSDQRQRVTGRTSLFYQRTEAKGWTQGMSFAVGLKSSTWWNLTVGPSLTRVFVLAQFVTRVTDATFTPTYGVRYVFAPLRQIELVLETRCAATRCCGGSGARGRRCTWRGSRAVATSRRWGTSRSAGTGALSWALGPTTSFS